MSVRSTQGRFVGMLAVCAGAIGLVGMVAGGCGGSVDGEAPTPTDDSGVVIDTATTPDTAVADTAKEAAVDSSKPAVDSGSGIDAPGSLFDVLIPDVVFEGGTAAGCYDCTKSKCSSELTACDKDEKCRSLVLCITVDCAGDTTDFSCLLACAGSAGVSPSPSDPVVAEALAVAQCTQKNCADKCPAIPGGATDAGAPSDARRDAPPADGGAPEASPDFLPGALPSSAAPMSIDPKMMEALKQFGSTVSGQPEIRRAVIDHLSHE